MSDVLDFALMDIQNRYGTAQTAKTDEEYVSWRDQEKKKGTTDLSFEDMLLLMVTQFQNQSIDNQADTNDMMNQLIQMTVMQAVTAVTQQVEELTTANVMSYSASLVGKEVTLGLYDEEGNIYEKVGVVQGTGTYDGAQIIFVDGESYFLSSIMGVGRLPERKPEVPPEEGGEPENPDGTDAPDKTEDVENSGAAGGANDSGDTNGEETKSDGETEVARASGTAGI